MRVTSAAFWDRSTITLLVTTHWRGFGGGGGVVGQVGGAGRRWGRGESGAQAETGFRVRGDENYQNPAVLLAKSRLDNLQNPTP